MNNAAGSCSHAWCRLHACERISAPHRSGMRVGKRMPAPRVLGTASSALGCRQISTVSGSAGIRLSTRMPERCRAPKAGAQHRSSVGSGRGAARAEDAQGAPTQSHKYAQGAPTQSHISPSIRVYEDKRAYIRQSGPDSGFGIQMKVVSFVKLLHSGMRHDTAPSAWHWSHWSGRLVDRVRKRCLFSA
jgi:hypothetical protein